MTKDVFDIPADKLEAETKSSDDNLDALVTAHVGEGKRFKSVGELLKAKLEADETVGARNRELEEYRRRLENSVTLQDFLEEIKGKQSTVPNQSHEEKPNSNNISDNQSKSPVDLEAVKALVKDTIKETSKNQTREQNIAQVQNELIKTYGANNLAAKLANKAEELGLTKEQMNELAASSPKAFINLFAPAKSTDFGSLPPSSNRAGSLSDVPNNGGVKTYKQWQDLKRTNKDEYFSTRSTEMRMADAKKLGTRYFE